MPDSKDQILNTHHPGIPKPVDLTGCTFQGKKLSAQELEERERRSAAMEEHRKTVDKKVILIRKHVKATGNQEETRKVSVRGRFFSPREIRKEYGIMAKPYDSHTLNVLWCIVHKSPVDLRAIADIMEYADYKIASRHFSGALSNLWTCLGDKEPYGCNWISRQNDHGRYFYSVVGEVRSVEVMHAKYLEINKRVWQAKRDAKKAANNRLGITVDTSKIDTDASNFPSKLNLSLGDGRGTPGDYADAVPDPEATIENEARKAQEELIAGRQGEGPIKKAIEQYLERIIGLTVEVNGSIDINVNFGFKERK